MSNFDQTWSGVEPDDEIGGLEKAFTALARAIFNIWATKGKSNDPGELDKSSYFALAIVEDSGSMSVSDLSTRMGLDTSTVSRIVGQLYDLGFVEKEKDSRDGRVYKLKLAPAGEQVLHQACLAKKLLLEMVTRHWTTQDRRKMTDLMERMADSLREVSQGELREISQLSQKDVLT